MLKAPQNLNIVSTTKSKIHARIDLVAIIISNFLMEPLTYHVAARFISNIPGFKDEHDNILGTWLDAVLPKEGKWLHCFRAIPGWQGHEFHSACDGKGPTVILIRVQQNIFGGFLDNNWGGKCAFIV